MNRLSENVCDMIEDALSRLLSVNEVIEDVDFNLCLAPTPGGLVTVGLVHIGMKGMLLGSIMRHTNITDLGDLTNQTQVDTIVRSMLEIIRVNRAKQLNGPIQP